MKNKHVKAQIKTRVSNFNKTIAKKDKKGAQEILNQSIKLLDKAASKHLIHKNKAANKKSKLTKKFNDLKDASEEKTPKPKPKSTKSSSTKTKSSKTSTR